MGASGPLGGQYQGRALHEGCGRRQKEKISLLQLQAEANCNSLKCPYMAKHVEEHCKYMSMRSARAGCQKNAALRLHYVEPDPASRSAAKLFNVKPPFREAIGIWGGSSAN